MNSIQRKSAQSIGEHAPAASQCDTASTSAFAPSALAAALPDASARSVCRVNLNASMAPCAALSPPSLSPLRLTAAAWGPPPGLPDVVPWHEADEALRSCAGLNAGVYFIPLYERDIAAKLPAHPEREVAATWLAGAVGLTVPETRLEAQVPEHVRQMLPRGPESPLLVMERVRGHHFGELRPCDVQDLRVATPRGKHLCERLGRVTPTTISSATRTVSLYRVSTVPIAAT